MKATLKGLQFVFDDKDKKETLDIVMEYASKENREHQRFMLETELMDAMSQLTQENGLGWMTDKQWKTLYDHLLEFEALPSPFDYKSAYNDRFLQAVYEQGQLQWP